MSFISVTAFGTLTRDVESKSLPSGMTVCQFAIASNRKVKGEDKATFLDCKAFDKTAENIAKFFAKGQRIIVVGELEQERWDDKTTGEKRSKLTLLVNRFDFPEPKGANDGDQPRRDEEGKLRREKPPRREAPPATDIGDDDVSF